MTAVPLAVARSIVPDPLADLNPEQRLAVEHGVANGDHTPLLVIAGAGSGKTDTLAHRVAHLVASGADPQRLLLLTFSRRAATEMERRAGRILARVLGTAKAGTAPPALPWAGTFHSVGARLLREHASAIALDPSFTVHDRGDSEDLMALVRHDLELDATERRFPGKGTCLAIYSRAVNAEAPLAEVLADAFPWCAAWEQELNRLFQGYVDAKQAQNVLDYDDLLLYWAQMAAEPSLGAELGARFDFILVDEYQDTNRLQASILRGMKPGGRGVTVVGDDAQSIYAFRAATVRNILDFPKSFAAPARTVTLERNYRSSQPILDASNAVIDLARERFTKNLWTDRTSGQRPQLVSVRDEADQARCVAEQVLAYREDGMTLKSQAVLFRASSHSATLELELARRNIPFVKFGGLRFLEAAHVKDVLCVLRWAENPRGRLAGFRVARLTPGIGPAIATRLLDAMAGAADPVTALIAFEMPRSAREAWTSFVDAYRRLREGGAGWPAEIDTVLGWYAPQLVRLYDDTGVREADLEQLRRIASTYRSRERFLTELTLDPPEVTSDEASTPSLDEDYLVLSTIHSAKGQEWKAVQMLNVVDGCIPSDLGTGSTAELEEERRLLYVGMTRARDHLRLMVPQRFYVHQQNGLGDRHVYASRTRFIPDTVAQHFDRVSWPAASVGAPARSSTAAPAPAIDLAARIRARWR